VSILPPPGSLARRLRGQGGVRARRPRARQSLSRHRDPRGHHAAFVDLPAGLVTRLFLVAQRVSRALRTVCRPDAITHVIAETGWNLVAHYKLHLIPRHVGERVRIDWYRGPAPAYHERVRQAAALRDALGPEPDAQP